MKKNNQSKIFKKGFTLIEMLIVIAIIGILASMVIVSLGPSQAKARDAKRMSDLRQIQNMLEIYYTANGGYPSSGGSVEEIEKISGQLNNLQTTQGIPTTDPSGRPYCYESTGTLANGAAGYSIGTQLEISSSSNSCMSSCSGSNGNTTNPNYCLSF